MLHYASIYLAVAMIAGWFGFGVAASVTAILAKIVFLAFLNLFVFSLLMSRKAPSAGSNFELKSFETKALSTNR